MTNDPIYKLQAAYHHLKAFGEDVQLPTRKKVIWLKMRLKY